MSDPENTSGASGALPEDLFTQLPSPSAQVPHAESEVAAPGSRRARREGLEDGADVAAEPVSSSDNAPRTAVWSSAPTLEQLFDKDPRDADSAKQRRKRGRKGCLPVLIVFLVIAGLIAGGGIWAWNNYGSQVVAFFGGGEPEDWDAGIAEGEAIVTIAQGDTGGPISKTLFEAGVTRTEDVFYDHLIATSDTGDFYPGVYRLQKKMTAAAALEAIRDPASKLDNSLSIAEGGTFASSAESIAQLLEISVDEVNAQFTNAAAYGVPADNLEGWLFPAVYDFDPEVTLEQVIQRMVDRTREALATAGVAAGDEQRVLTIASIVQREGFFDDFGKVSRVIQNRLAIDQRLEMDSTAQYGVGELHDGSAYSSSEALKSDNPWNTYVHTGLPKGPISNPSQGAIDAALNPEEGPWLYFVAVDLSTGETVFSETYEEQLAAEERLRAWCAANPDGGC